jgi:archaellum component FlaC
LKEKEINNLIDEINSVDVSELFDQVSENLNKLENIFKKIKSTDKDQNFKKDIKKNKKFINYLKKVYEDLKTE